MAQAAHKYVETALEVFKPEAPRALHRWLERLDIRAAAAARICCHQWSVGRAPPPNLAKTNKAPPDLHSRGALQSLRAQPLPPRGGHPSEQPGQEKQTAS